MLTPEQAFRVGFLARCSEEGLHGEALNERNLAFAVPMAGGAIAGAGLGTLAGNMAGPEDPGKIKPPPFLKSVQRSEYAAALRQQAAELHRMREAQAAAPTPMRSRYGI